MLWNCRVAVLILSSCVFLCEAKAEVLLGAGPSYSNLVMGGRGSSYYLGPGGMVQLRIGSPWRLRRAMIPRHFRESFGYWLFAHAIYEDISNTNKLTGKSMKQRLIGGGADLQYKNFFVGIEYNVVSGVLTSPSYYAQFVYDTLGPRIGTMLESGAWVVEISGAMNIGATSMVTNEGFVSRSITQFRLQVTLGRALGGARNRLSEQKGY